MIHTDALYWGTVFMPTDIDNPETGEPLYVHAKVRPAWYWFLRRVQLFALIVWRRYETERIGVRLAWELSDTAVGVTGRTWPWRKKRECQ